MKLWVLCTLCIITSLAAADTETCMKDLDIGSFTFSASSETQLNPASKVFTDGWCASNTTNDQHIDIQFKTAMGFKALTVGPKDEPSSSYPKSVRVQYIPFGSTTLQDFPVPGGLVIQVDAPTHSTFRFNQGLAVLNLRFVLQDFEKEPCMKIALKGCTMQDLCPVCVHGTCLAENHCQCYTGYLGDGCDRKECTPVVLGLGDGSLPGNQITVSSELSPYTKEEIRNAEGRKGWCPADSDKHPWASISLDKPMAVKMLQFDYVLKTPTYPEKMYMSEFELLYIAPQDSSRLLRSFHTDIPSLNGTHYFTVSLVPAVITDTVFIRATNYNIRSCFKLELYGCDPKGMCSQNWCQNGGSCVGENACACANGFFGERCELKKTDIPTVNTTFLSITNNVLITTSLHFTVTGQVTLDITSQIPVLFLTGLGSFVQLKETSTTIACLKDINKCTAGLTFALDVKFDKLLDNTYILSSGGNLQNTHGIALYYTQNTLVYIVTTTNFRWTLQVPYTPVLNVWQHFEITWNKNIGMELHLNGHLLGTVGRPDPVSTSQTVDLCIGCSHTTLQVQISMHIKEFHVWTIDRTELVNAGLKPNPAPVTTSAPGASTPNVPATSTIAPTSTKAATTPAPVVTTPDKGYQEYNLTFISIVNNLLITPTFNFTLHGKPTLELQPNSHTAIVLDCTKQQYVELPDQGIPCLEDMAECSKGFTFRIQVQFTSIDVAKKTYILSSGGDIETASGMAIYLHSNQLIFGVKQGMRHWSASYNMTGIIKINIWYSFEISWSSAKGVNVVIDGYEVINNNDWTPFPATSKTNPVLIGKTEGSNTTSCMKVRDLFTWTTHRDVLVSSGILQNTSLMMSTSSTSSSTTTTTTTPIPTTTVKRDPLNPYDLICIKQQGNILHTRENSLTFLSHGNPVLNEVVPSILYSLTLNSLTGDYLELRNKGVTCIDNFDSCKEGFTVLIKVVIVSSSQSSKIYIVSNEGENGEKSGIYLYHQGSNITLGFRHETHLWETSKQYTFIPGVLYTCLFSWSETDGLLLYINNYLIGSVPVPVNVPLSSSPGVFLIGKTIGHAATTIIYDLKIWVTSFKTLLYHTVFTALPTTTRTTTTVTATRPSTTDSLHSLVTSSSYNLTFISIQNNILYTPKYTFSVIGSPVLHTPVSGKTALELNSSKGEYIELSNNTIPCLTDYTNCSNGFTFHIQVKFLQTDETKKIYIVGNGGNEPGTDTFYLYYQNHKLYFGNTVEHFKWSSEIQFEIRTNIFQAFELSWSYQHGLQLFLNGDLLKSSNVTSQVNTSSTLINTISIGKSSGSMSTFALMISDVHFWSVSRHFLTAANVITTTIPLTTAGQLSSTRQKEISQSTGHSSTTIYQVTTNKHISSTSTRVTSLKEQTSTLSAEASTVSNFISTQPTKTSTAHIKTENHIFKFFNVTGNTIFTTAFTLTAHGDIHIVNIANNQTAIRLNATNGEYMELKNDTLFCKTTNNCYGFVNSIKLNFQSIDYNIKVYILKGPGIYLYYLNKSLHFAYSIGHELWVSHVNYEVRVNLWHTFELKWSKVTGLSLIVDGSNLQTVGKSVHTTVSTNQTQTFTIGLVTTSTSTTFLISGFEILRELYTVEASPITSSSATTFPSKFTESTTKSSHTVFTTIKKTTEQTPKLSSFQQTTVHTSTNALNKSTTKDQATFSNSKTTLLPESSTYSFLYTSRREASPTGWTAVSGEVSYPSYESTKVDASSIASYKTTPVGHTTRPNMQTTTDSKATTTSSNTFYSSSLASSAFPETTYMNSITTQKPYNLGFLNITDQKILTHSYTFTAHGNISLSTAITGQHVVQINTSKHEYIELRNQSIPCIDNKHACTGGFSFQMNINFINIDYSKPTYIIQTTGKSHTGSGIFLYILNSTLHLGYTYHNLTWTTNVKYELKTESWYTFKLTWSMGNGLGLYINGKLVTITNKPKTVNVASIPTSLTIGMNQINVMTIFQTYGIMIWPYYHETVYPSTITTSSHKSTTENNMESTTLKVSLQTSTTYAQTSSVKAGITTSPMFYGTDNTNETPTEIKNTVYVSSTLGNDKITKDLTSENYKSTPHDLTTEKTTQVKSSYGPTKVDASSIASYKTTPVGHTTRPNIQTTTDSKATTTSSNTFYSSSLASSAFSATTYMNSITTQKPYNLGFLNITDQKIFTHSYTFTAHGNINLSTAITGQHVVQINTSKHEYIELKNQSIPCIDNKHACTGGFSFQMNINFINIDYSKPTYIIQTTGNSHTGSGIFLYILNSTLYLGYTYHNLTWTTNVKYELKTESWYTFKLTWSMDNGLGLYINGKLVTITNKPKTVNVASIPTSLTIGMNQINVMTIFQTYGIMIWPYYHETVYPSTITTSSHKSTTENNMESTTLKVSLQTSTTYTQTSSVKAGITTSPMFYGTDNTNETPTEIKNTVYVSSTLGNDKITKDLTSENYKSTPHDLTPEKTTQVKSSYGPTKVDASSIASYKTTPVGHTTRPNIQTTTDSKATTTSSNTFYSSSLASSAFPETTYMNSITTQKPYNLGFLNITDQKIFTHSYTFTAHGNISLSTSITGQHVVQINTSKHEYIELKNQSIPCIDNKHACTGGFSFQMNINFINIDYSKTTYIIQTTGNAHTGSGIFLYILNSTLYLGYTYHNLTWTTNVKYELKTESWYTFKLTWSMGNGLGLYINGKLVTITNKPKTVNVAGIPTSLTIGMNQINVMTIFQTYGIMIWPYDHETVYPSTIATSSHKSTTNDKHSTQTDSKITTTTRMQASSITEIVKSSQVPNVTITHTFLSLSTVPSSSTRGPVITTVATPVSPEPGLTTISTTVKEISPIASNTDSTSSTVEPTSVNFHTSTITRHNTEHSIMTNKPISFESHNLSFINITGNLIYTASFIISTHGIVTLEKTSSNETAVRLNGTTRGFIELKTPNISCIDHHESCKNGFTVKLKVKFLTVNTYKKTYILVSSGSIPGSSGIILYYQNNTLYFTSISEHRTWESSIHFEIIQNAWHTYELSWSLSYGLGLYIDGTLVKSTNVSTISSTDIPSRPGSLIVGTALGANYSASLLVTGLHIWSASREIVYQAHAQSTEPSSPTPAPTTPTTTTTTTTTTKPTTTLPPVPSFTWNFTQTVNLTINGNVPIKDGGLYFTNATQYIDFGNGTLGCLLNPTSCKDGLTVQFTIVFKRVEENTYLLTSGGQLPNGMGLAIIFRFNYFQFVLSTSTQSWYATCHRSELTPNKPHNIMISWQLNLGLEVFINNVLITSNKNPATHVTTSVSITNVYFGKQTSVIVTGNAVKVDYILQTITFWYAHIHILVERGYCKPPVRPTEKPTTVAPITTAKPVTTQKQTSSVTTMFTKPSTQQCPVGCVSIASTKQPTATPSSTKRPSTPKPTNPTPPPPNTATPSPKPTTERGPPNYTTKPTLNPIVSNDTKAYLVCVFKASTRDVQFIVQLKVDGQVVDQKVNPGQSGVVMFEVSKLNENLYEKKITCSVVAKYVGGTHTTGPFPSTALIPHFTVTNKHIIVVEGKSTQFVTVTSTTPPQFYCCKGCRGECQVHIVGSNYFNHRTQQKCNNNYIAQSVIVSSKPPTSNSHICGFALTNQNWDHNNKIEVKATIDNRRDGDHTNTMSIIAHVYNQPANVQISAKPSYSFTITNVQVTAKDNHASSTCKSVNDPHMRTFDGMNYNNMNEGVFVLYRHKSMPFEVRALYHKCNKRSHATCNCGVAVQSGDDVITVTGCHGTNINHPGQGHGIGLIMQQLFGNKNNELAKTPMTIQIYKNGEFTPGTLIRRFGCGQKYEIELPTGMIVTVQQSYKPFINIYIRGASTDKAESEGLCGNFDGSRTNDLKPSTAAFINAWKSTYENFFFGVAVSSVQFQSTYCSCIKDKNKICLSGIGAFRCVLTNNDITSSLVKQAKRPILTRHKRQAVDPTMVLPATDIPTEEPIDSPAVAEKNCTDHITKSSVTGSCEPVLTSNVTQHIQNCVDDYLATGSYEWAKDALRDIAVECIDNINDLRLANESGNTNITDELPDIPDIEEILNKSCVDDCGDHGSCVQGVCVCDDGYSGVTCDISKATVPTTSIVPFLCDMSSTSDCQGAMVFGENFVDTSSLTCHYQFATVGNVITPSGEKGTVPANFISINQVECPLPRPQTAILTVGNVITPSGEKGTVPANFISINQVECPLPRPQTAILTVSNDGTNPSTNASMQVVFNSMCHSCSVDDQTFKASCYRQDNNCIIDGTCYANEATRPGDQCQVCRPAANNNQWSQSLETICQEKPQASFVKDDDTKEKTTIALAIVCGVLAAIIVIGAICLIRKKGMSKKSKGEFGSYDFTPTPSVHRQQFTTADNPAYVGTGEKM